MKGLEGRFKITRGGLLKKHLGVNYEWGVLPNGKSFCRATMEKKVNALVEAYIKHIGKEAKNLIPLENHTNICRRAKKTNQWTLINIDHLWGN